MDEVQVMDGEERTKYKVNPKYIRSNLFIIREIKEPLGEVFVLPWSASAATASLNLATSLNRPLKIAHVVNP